MTGRLGDIPRTPQPICQLNQPDWNTVTETPTHDPHELCETDPEKGLCSVDIPLVEAAWRAVVDQGAAGELDREETLPVLIAALGGVQHHLGHHLREHVVVTMTFSSDDFRQAMTDMARRMVHGPAEGVSGRQDDTSEFVVCKAPDPNQPGWFCVRRLGHGGKGCDYMPADQLPDSDDDEGDTHRGGVSHTAA